MSVRNTEERPRPGVPCPTTGLTPRPRPSTARPENMPARRGPHWWRWLRRCFEAALIAGGLYALWHERHDVSQAARLFTHLSWPWVAAAAAAEVASMVVFARLQRWLLRAGGVDLGLGAMTEITVAGNSLSVSLPGGAAWSAAWAFEQLRRRGADRTLAVWVLLVAGALGSFALFVLMVAGVWIAGSTGPVSSLRSAALGLALIPVAAGALFVAARRSRAVRRWLVAVVGILEAHLPWGDRVGRGLRTLVHRLAAVQPSRRDWAATFAMALLNWIYDAACLVLSMLALGIPVPWRGLLVAYALAQLGASLPITPGGIGVVEGSLSLALIAYGVHPNDAVAAALLYRVISFWALVPVGWAAWSWLELQTRHDRRGSRHHPWAWHHGVPARDR